MAMLTTCPACKATFKVTTQQLDVHQGDVRCGKCNTVFNAFDTLFSPPESLSVHETVSSPVAPEPASQDFSRKPEQIVEVELPREEIRHEEEIVPDSISPDLISSRAEAGHSAGDMEDFDRPSLQEQLHEVQENRRKHWQMAGLMVVLVLLVSGLAGQGIYFKRNEIAAIYPQFKPALEEMCGVLGCRVSLLQNNDAIKIESSELQADPDHPNLVALSAVLRNLARYPQAYPLLELSLTDTDGKTIARRLFQPKEYLEKGAVPGKGMPANEEVLVKLNLDFTDLGAVGFKLYAFYP
jgi:predicted Zn finger-like uncharacterized protein